MRVILKPTFKKIIAPLVLLGLALIRLIFPLFSISIIIFEYLAVPFGRTLDSFRYQDKQFLTPTGTLIVGVAWAIVLYVIICLIGARKKNNK